MDEGELSCFESLGPPLPLMIIDDEADDAVEMGELDECDDDDEL